MGVKLGDSNTRINTGGKDRIKMEDLFELAKFPNQDFRTFRPRGEIFAYGTHWFELIVITKEGERKKFRTGRACRNVKLDGTIDPSGGCGYCKVNHSPRTSYFQNMLDIEAEENAPRKLPTPTPEERKAGFKIQGTKTWTPNVVLSFPPTVAETMQKLTKKNKDKEGRIRELSDPSFGRALDISKDTRDGVSPGNMWNVQKADDDMRKLTQDQKSYLLWDISSCLKKLIPSAKESLEDMKRNVPLMVDADFDKLDLSEFPELVAKRKGGGKKSKSGKFKVDEDDDEDDDLPKRSKRRVIDEDDDEDDIPRRSKKRASDEDDDEDETPRRSTKKKGKKRKSFDINSVM